MAKKGTKLCKVTKGVCPEWQTEKAFIAKMRALWRTGSRPFKRELLLSAHGFAHELQCEKFRRYAMGRKVLITSTDGLTTGQNDALGLTGKVIHVDGHKLMEIQFGTTYTVYGENKDILWAYPKHVLFL